MSIRTNVTQDSVAQTPESSEEPELTLEDVKEEVRKFLYENPNKKLNETFENVEQQTSVKRDHILCTLLGLVIFYISFGQHREGISDVIGFAYPCYQTLVCLTNSTGQERRLMIYWLVFGFFQLVDYAADQICSIFPFYFLFKTCVYLYLLIPATKGIEKMDKMVLRPFLARSNDLAVWLQKSD